VNLHAKDKLDHFPLVTAQTAVVYSGRVTARLVDVHNVQAVCGSCGKPDIWVIGVAHERDVIVIGCRTCQAQSSVRIAHDSVDLTHVPSRPLAVAADTCRPATRKPRTRRRR